MLWKPHHCPLMPFNMRLRFTFRPISRPLSTFVWAATTVTRFTPDRSDMSGAPAHGISCCISACPPPLFNAVVYH